MWVDASECRLSHRPATGRAGLQQKTCPTEKKRVSIHMLQSVCGGGSLIAVALRATLIKAPAASYVLSIPKLQNGGKGVLIKAH